MTNTPAAASIERAPVGVGMKGGRLAALVPMLALIALVIAWWLPAGFDGGAIMDEWSLLVWIDDGARPFYYPDIAPTRPLTYNAWIASWALTPGSFVGMNALLCAIHALKGVLMFALLRRLLPTSPLFAWIGAAIFALFPADHGIFYMGLLNIQLTVALVLLALVLLLEVWARPTVGRWIALLAVQTAAVMTYEAGIPLMLCAPALILYQAWQAGRTDAAKEDTAVRRGSRWRRWLIVSGVWSVIPAAWFAFFIYTLTSGDSAYQAGLLDTGAGRWSLFDGIGYMFRQNFIGGYLTGAQSLSTASPAAIIAAAIIGISVIGGAWIAGRSVGAARGGVRTHGMLIALGLAATLVGFIVYIPTSDFSTQHYTWRLSMFTAIGTAITLAAALTLLPRWIAGAAAGVLIALGAVHGMVQHADLQARSATQQRIVSDVIAAASPIADGTLIALYDASGTDDGRALYFNYVFEHALQLTVGTRTIYGRVCFQDGESARESEQCDLTDAGFAVSGIWGGIETFAPDRVRALALQPDGTITATTVR
jgi:hypothetical protein